MDATEATPIAAPGVERKIGLAWTALAWEGLWPRLMPLLGLVALFIAAAHLDLFGGLDPWVHTGVLAALALAFIGVAWWRFRSFTWPLRGDPPPRNRFRGAAPALARRAGSTRHGRARPHGLRSLGSPSPP
jgi:hypothetical protein